MMKFGWLTGWCCNNHLEKWWSLRQWGWDDIPYMENNPIMFQTTISSIYVIINHHDYSPLIIINPPLNQMKFGWFNMVKWPDPLNPPHFVAPDPAQKLVPGGPVLIHFGCLIGDVIRTWAMTWYEMMERFIFHQPHFWGFNGFLMGNDRKWRCVYHVFTMFLPCFYHVYHKIHGTPPGFPARFPLNQVWERWGIFAEKT